MPLRPFQSRLVSLSTTLPLLLLLLSLVPSSPSAALAAEGPADQRPQDLFLDSAEAFLGGQDDAVDGSYEPGFELFDRDIIGRAAAGVTVLSKNERQALNLIPGGTACYVFQKSTIFAGNRRRRGLFGDDDDGHDNHHDGNDVTAPPPPPSNARMVYLSANTCLQPNHVSPSPMAPAPPQLRMYVSNSTQPGCLGAPANKTVIQTQTFDRGAAMIALEAEGDVYITIEAPKEAASDGFDGVYNFEVAASTDGFFHSYDTVGGQLLWMDSDSSSSLFVTRNLTAERTDTSRIMSAGPQFELFVVEKQISAVNGLLYSACGLRNNVALASKRLDDGAFNNGDMVRTKITTIGAGKLPKQQFYFDGLNSSTSYSAILYKPGNVTAAAGGGVVYIGTDFQTSAGTNCRVITDLEFCTEVQWAAPGNNVLNNSELARVYDDYARAMYANFDKVMMQIPCEAPPTQRYSLVKTCDDCRLAYRRWLCTVSIPRCEDFSKQNNFTVVRNAGQPFPNGTALPADLARPLKALPASNSSRNSFIDEHIAPGPYKEILPCADVCYEVVQSCPAAISFTCPLPNMVSFNASYGMREGFDDDVFRCNYPGEPRTRFTAAGAVLGRSGFSILGFVSFTLAMQLL
ncbi:Calcium influx-promoting protein ehs1 [Escovopsis weberi]|uniref:Calcium influx-promoting protein ehs1 n=1 Tax=Escovopsis weberi TaxID=150374 RepID=A0A0M8MSS9_ESCWE|nr:Calcium influx-promoting protein ehs1 [Escovopsis weberi]